MRVPPTAPPDIQQAFRELHERLDKVVGNPHAGHPNARGKRWTNVGDARDGQDLVTLKQVNDALDRAGLPLINDNTVGSNADAVAAAGDGTTPGDGGTSGGTDDGLGAQGCASCGPTGHVSAGAPLTSVTAGQVVCGTGQEFPSLTAACADQGTRDANQAQLLSRMIWHLQQAGFSAGKQRNPSGVISGDKLTVQVSGTYLAYDVFTGVNFDQALPVHMDEVFPASYVADSGTAD